MATEKYLSYIIQGDTEYIIQDPETSKKLDKPISVEPVAGSILGISPNAETITVTWVPYTDYLKDYALSSDLDALATRLDANYYTNTDLDVKLDLKADLVDGKVPAAQLPSYVDDVIEGYYFNGAFYTDTEHETVIEGEVSKIYVDLTNSTLPITYRYSGSTYIKISSGMEKEDYYTSVELDAKLIGKADLVDGVVPNTQLPNYTAWEVNPTLVDYEVDTYIIEDKYESITLRQEEGKDTPKLSNKRKITAQTVHKFKLRSCSDVAVNDVIIDWGDGSTSTIQKGEYVSQELHGSEYIYNLEHDYGKEGKFIIKVYGNCYFNITHNTGGNNLMSRVFDEDLPIAPHFRFLQNFCYGASRLLYVNIPPHHIVAYAASVVSLFAGCSNLRIAVGLSRMYTWSALYQLFYSCVSLLYTDLRCPTYVSNMSRLFCDCWSLKLNLDEFFDFPGFGSPSVDMLRAFYMGGPQRNMTGTLKPELFWNNTHTTFLNTSECFKNNTDLAAQAPESWGGTNSAASIDAKLIDRVIYLEQRVKYLEQLIAAYVVVSNDDAVNGEYFEIDNPWTT